MQLRGESIMKFVISTQQLNYLISKIQNIVPQKPTMPILTNFLIEAANDELTLTATDLIIGIRCNSEARILEEGSTTLPAKRLAQLLKELTATNIELSTNSNDITTLIAGSSRFKMNGMKKDEYPHFPISSHHPTLIIPQKVLKELLYRTSFAVSKDDTRYALAGLLMKIFDGQILFAGTDGKRLARAQAPINQIGNETYQSIIPSKAIDEIYKNLEDEGDAKINIYPDKVIIQINQTVLMSQLLTGEYPDISRIIPETSLITISLHREELMALLRQISLFINDHNHSVKFSFSEGELKLSANSSDFGEGDVNMPVNYFGEKFDIAINPVHLNSILSHCKEETVTLGLTDPFNPGVVSDGELLSGSLNQVSPLYIIMPMRLSE